MSEDEFRAFMRMKFPEAVEKTGDELEAAKNILLLVVEAAPIITRLLWGAMSPFISVTREHGLIK